MLRLTRSIRWAFILALGLAGAVLAGVSPRASAADKPDLVFLLIGQSNMAGRAPLAKEDSEPIAGVLLLNDKGAWEPATNPLNRYSNVRKDLNIQRVGPGDGFARALRKALPDKTIGLIVNARGGTRIEQWAKGTKDSLYDQMLERVKAVPDLQLAGVLWHQGEANAKDEAYPEKAAKLIANLRADFNQPELPFIAGQVYADVPVNKYLAALPEKVPHTACALAEGLKVFDGVHFDRTSQRILGERYAEAYLTKFAKK